MFLAPLAPVCPSHRPETPPPSILPKADDFSGSWASTDSLTTVSGRVLFLDEIESGYGSSPGSEPAHGPSNDNPGPDDMTISTAYGVSSYETRTPSNLLFPSVLRPKTVQVFVRTLKNKVITMTVSLLDSVGSVKKALRDQLGVGTHRMRLTFSGHELADNRLLSDYGVCDGYTLDLKLRVLGGIKTRGRAQKEEKNVSVGSGEPSPLISLSPLLHHTSSYHSLVCSCHHIPPLKRDAISHAPNERGRRSTQVQAAEQQQQR